VAEAETPLIPLRAWLAAAGLAAVMVIGTALSYLQSQQAGERAKNVGHTYRTLHHLDAIVPMLAESEDQQRIYMATRDPAPLAARRARRCTGTRARGTGRSRGGTRP